MYFTMMVFKQPSTAKPRSAATKRKSDSKKKIARLGTKIVRVKVGKDKEVFTVHEDLICAKSAYFKDRLQKCRKELDEECPVCCEDFNPENKNILFCKTCGKNVHEACIRKWQEIEEELHNPYTCPMCRAAWIEDTTTTTIECGMLKVEAFQWYLNWIYRDEFHPNENLKPGPIDDKYNQALARAYEFGQDAKDEEYQAEAISGMVQEYLDNPGLPGKDTISYVYKNTSGPCKMRSFLVDAYLAKSNFQGMLDKFKEGDPVEFLKDICARCYELGRKQDLFVNLIDEYLEKPDHPDKKRPKK